MQGLLELSVYTYAGLAVICSLLLSRLRNSEYDHLPTVGYSNWFLSFFSGFKFFLHADDMLQEGYDRFPSQVFKVANLDRWMVIVGGNELVNQLRKAPSDVCSMEDASNDTLELERTFGGDFAYNQYHVPIIRTQMVTSLGELFPLVRDEVQQAFGDAVKLTGDEWVAVPAFATVTRVISRVSNRVLVGLPLCRNAGYLKLCEDFAMSVVIGATVTKIFPSFMRNFAHSHLTGVRSAIDRGTEYLKPLINKRQESIDEYGADYPDKPNDFVSWIMDIAQGENRTARELSIRILAVNFAAIHTTSTSFVQMLFNLALMPVYAPILREEIESVVKEHGWSKASVAKMYKVDSFMRETQRMAGIGSIVMIRQVMKPFVFDDGTRIPVGAQLSVPSKAIHYDPLKYENPDVFDGLRFSKMRDEDQKVAATSTSASRHGFDRTSLSYVTFGHGNHSCPGRFFASQEMSLMLIHLVLSYDIRVDEEALKPKNKSFHTAVLADTKAKLLFRKRELEV